MPDASKTTYCIFLRPLCDRQFSHVADELIYRPGNGSTTSSDALTASARAYVTAFFEIGLSALVGNRTLLVPVPEHWVAQPDIMQLPTEKILVGLPEALGIDHDTLKNLGQLHEQGYRLLADDSLVSRNPDALLPLLSVVRFRLNNTDNAQTLRERIKAYACAPIELMVDNLETLEQFNHCRELPFSYFQGDFYASVNPVANATGHRAGNRAASLRLLRELYLPNPELHRIESLLIQDPHLCALLFKRANTASGERLRRVTKLQQIIMLLGYDKIRALTTTLLLAHNEPVKRFLVFKALVRASMARRLASHASGVDPDTALTAGLFSMMDQIEGIPLDTLVTETRLDPELEQALLQHQGELGKILRIIFAFENARFDRDTAGSLDQLNGDYLASVAWAQEIMAIAD